MSAPRLEVAQLTAGYEGAAVVRDVSLTVAPGEVVALLGANGAGKTTTLRAVSGAIAPMAGEIRLDGEPIERGAPHRLARRGVAHVPEGRGVFPGLSVEEHFRVRRCAAQDVRRAFGYFPALERLRDRRAGLLSGGEQQMLALAAALAHRPRLLLVDELSLGLAPVIVERLMPVLRAYASESGCGVVLVEQHVQLALEVADRGVVLSRGAIVAESSAEALRTDRSLIVASYLGESGVVDA